MKIIFLLGALVSSAQADCLNQSTIWNGTEWACVGGTIQAGGGTDYSAPIAALGASTATLSSAKQDADADLSDLADGSLTASKVASGYAAAGLVGKVPNASIDLSTVTAALPSKTKTTANVVFYTSATATNLTELAFSLAANTSYYFEFDINHQSTATATGVWFGMTYPAASTITWNCIQHITATTVATNMSRGAAFLPAAGATVDIINSSLPARITGTISTLGAGTLTPTVKAELQTGRGTVMAGSYGRLLIQ